MEFIRCGKLKITMLALIPFVFSAISTIGMMFYDYTLNEFICIWYTISHFLLIWITVICIFHIIKIIKKSSPIDCYNDVHKCTCNKNEKDYNQKDIK